MATKLDQGKSFHVLLPWIIPAVVLLGWIALSKTGLIPNYLLPHPLEIGKAGYSYIFGNPGEAPYAGRFLGDAGASLIRVLSGFASAVFLGIPLGIISGRLAVVQKLMNTSINGLRAVPGICWLPLAMIWFGIGMKTTVFLVALAAFFPIYINAAAGARQIDPLLLQAGAMMGVKRLRGTFAILLPGAMPHIITGLRLGLGVSWAYLVLGELTGVPNVGILVIATIGRISDQLLQLVLKSFFKSARRIS